MTLALKPFPWRAGADALAAWHTETAAEIARYVVASIDDRHPGFNYDPATIAKAIRTLETDHSGKSPTELASLARDLTPGGAHDDALLINIVRQVLPFTSPELTVATMYQAWKGGKIGFQFLPDPTCMSLEEYKSEVDELLFTLEHVHPHQILIDEDLDFAADLNSLDRSLYDSLPDSFTVYRGCHGVTPEQCGAGVCWTTEREIAEWFARRGSYWAEPVVVTTRARKCDVRLAFASEHEVVMRAWGRARPLKVRPAKRSGRPPMRWSKSELQVAI